ncbi:MULTISPECIES: GNAT family N-acetyltransferase [Bacillales]|uniref:GNAT family N-acetyltransferase n=1 Tax=Bacillales TaxID=1385 RepID=UPI001883DFA5|nr:GNAT family N-acetyltransferase [Pseudalkalibacillus hwajinpoensis]MBF0708767.1 GNAT family N-acetyltransferase [Pseudalkalibacillus hwajinpoensis]
MHIRPFKENDLIEMIDLFYDTVHSINRRDYTNIQVNAWANKTELNRRHASWGEEFERNFTYVATLDKQIVGFCDLTSSGLLDRLYVHKDYQRKGIASELLEKVQQTARLNNMEQLHTEASITAVPFFREQGFSLVKSQLVEKNGIQLKNFLMAKEL